MYLHSIAETEELKQKRINGIHQDLFKLTAEMEFRGNGNRIIGGESVIVLVSTFPFTKLAYIVHAHGEITYEQ